MAEIQLIRIKALYGDLKGLLSQIPHSTTTSIVDQFLVSQINQIIDTLTNVSKSDYSTYKIPEEQRYSEWPESFPANIVRAQLGRIISRLENEYSFGQSKQSPNSPGIVIFNKNQSEISLQINYSITDLIEHETNEESKEKLKNLERELEKNDKDWESIKSILYWILNFSKDLFLKVIPILLEKKL